MATKKLPSTKSAFAFDPKTREFIGPVQVHLAPMEGTYFLPANVVAFAPKRKAGPRQKVRLNDAGDAWEIVDDFRGAMLWDKETARPVINALALAESPPASLTVLAPPQHAPGASRASRWARDRWESIPDYSSTALYEVATGHLSSHRLAVGEALSPALTAAPPPRLLANQALRWDAVALSWLVDTAEPEPSHASATNED
jgi:hypothetical protein